MVGRITRSTRHAAALAAGVALVGLSLSSLNPVAADQVGGDPQAELRETAAKLEKHYARLEELVRQAPRASFDPQALLESVGRDPAALAAYVRDKTDLLPYRGALRGSRGALIDGGGNSLDRSLLLAELLTSSGHAVRLANAKLSDEQAKALAAKVSPARQNHPQKRLEVTPEMAEARRRAARHADDLVATVGNSAAAAQSAAAALGDHWWVQRNDGSNWVDVDVCGVVPLPAPARTVPFTPDNELPLDAADVHEVTFRVVIESVDGGKLKTQTVIEQPLRPAEMIGRRVTFSHFIGPAMKDELFQGTPESRKQFKEAMAKQPIWAPSLKVGRELICRATFTTAGAVDTNPSVDAAGQVGGLSQPTGGMFGGGGLLGGGGGSKDASGTGGPDVLTAEWIEYEIRVPGEQPRTVRRTVFDLIGPAARAAGTVSAAAPTFTEQQKLERAMRLLGETQVELQACDLPVDYVEFLAVDEVLRDKDVWLDLAKLEAKTPEEVEDRLNEADNVYHWSRIVAALRSAVSPAPEATYIDRPNLVHVSYWPQERPDGSWVMAENIDLAFTSTRAPDGAFAARVRQGVADTLAERVAAGREAPALENTIDVFEAAGVTRRDAVKVASAADATALDPLKLSPDVRARARNDLADGNVLVLAGKDGRFGWWRVDAATGQTVGVMDSGYHQAQPEYQSLNIPLSTWCHWVRNRMGAEAFKRASYQEIMKFLGRTTLYMDEYEALMLLQRVTHVGLGRIGLIVGI